MSTPSVVTCDLEGRIQTFNKGAQQLFGYKPHEVIGKKRVSLFSPGLIVLGHVGRWLQTAVKEGVFETRTVFQRKDGSRFVADIKITPTFHRNEHIGYCGVTVEVPNVSIDEAMPKISFGTRLLSWLVITRAPFLTATLVPMAVGAAWSLWRSPGPLPWSMFGVAVLGAVLLHLAANTFNDYFDWKSGTDEANADYFQPFSGGSRSIELGLVTEKGLLRLAQIMLVLASVVGVVLLWWRGPGLLAFGALGAFSAFFYTAPPLRLAARKGLGELLVGLNFGPLLVAGTAYILTGHVGWEEFAAGLPVGFLTTAILWINEFPDAPSDALTGKNNLVVVLGLQRARWGFVALLVLGMGSVLAGVVGGFFPMGALAAFLAVPIAVKAARVALQHSRDRQLIQANQATIRLQLVAGLLLAAGLLVAQWNIA